MPKVSIVLPTYNGMEYIRESIDSILMQTFSDWELIIVNDCSSDKTPDIIAEYVKNDSRIRFINNKLNQKLPKSLNIGFAEAEGQYLTWTSDDNIFKSTAIMEMVNYLDDNSDEMMVCTKMDIVSADRSFIRFNVPYSDEFMYYGDCVGGCFLYRKEILTEIGEYNPDFFLVEDYEYWLRILFTYKHIGYIDKSLYEYRSHSNNLSSTRTEEQWKRNSILRTKYIDYLVDGLANRVDLICRMYFEIERFYGITEEVRRKTYRYVNDLLRNRDYILGENTIVYGAGQIGNNFFDKYADVVCYYADKDEKKVGKYINNRRIISLEEMEYLANDYQIVVAAGVEKIYDFLMTLYSYNISSYYIYSEDWI